MNQEQVKSGIRWAIGAVGGYFVGRGWVKAETIQGLLNNPEMLGAIASLAIFVWGLFVHTQKNAVAVADAVPGVKGVVMKPTAEGIALADSIPSNTVVSAGTPQAAAIANVKELPK